MAKKDANKTKGIILALVIVAIIAAIAGLQHLSVKAGVTQRQEIGAPVQTAAEPDGPGMMIPDAERARVEAKQKQYTRGVELADPTGFVNAEPFNLSQYVGKKVILIDFWTYSCINCQRTLPYLTSWDAKYRDDGLLIVGVHTPEFDFEKDINNVRKATQKFGIAYPVVLDSNHGTWSAYRNQYWPREYLIDIDGFIVHDHIGEGEYDETERAIQAALAERRDVLGLNMTIDSRLTAPVEAPQFGKVRTPEMYFGYAFARGHLASPEGWQPEMTVAYTTPKDLDTSVFYLAGSWKNNPDNMESVRDSRVSLRYTSKYAYIVAGADTPTDVQVLVDGEPAGTVRVSDQTLYTTVAGAGYGSHTLELRVPPGVRIYTFTFG